jgi:hypothetical protein
MYGAGVIKIEKLPYCATATTTPDAFKENI